MAKRRKRKRRKQRIVRHMNVDTSQNIPVTQRFGTIETPERLYSIKHAGSFETGAHKRLNIDTQYKKVRTVLGMAEHALENDCDFHAIAEARAVENREIREKFSYDPWDYAACQPIYDNFSYKKMGMIELRFGWFRNEQGQRESDLFIADGLHRCVSLTCLLLQEKIEFQPIPATILFYGDDSNHPDLAQ